MFFFTDFQTIPQDDQLVLIRKGFYEIWLTRISRLINSSDDDGVLFSDGSLIPRSELALIYSVSVASIRIFIASNFIHFKF